VTADTAWPWTRPQPLTPVERAQFQWMMATERTARPPAKPSRLPYPRPLRVIEPVADIDGSEPLREFQRVQISNEDELFVYKHLDDFTRRLGLKPRSLAVAFYRAGPWTHRGLWSSRYPTNVHVRVGQTWAQTLGTLAHETAHAAGVDDEDQAERVAMRLLDGSGYEADAQLPADADPLAETWARCLRARGIQA
jgi:hypothetical protein